MATVRDLIRGALIRINVLDPRQSVGNLDAATGLTSLNALLDQWATSELYVYAWTPQTFSTVAGQSEYTLGPAGDWALDPRPPMIEDGFVTVNGYDYPIRMIDAAQWSDIYWKSFSSLWPEYMFVQYGVPTNTVQMWPTPAAAYDVTIRVPVRVGAFALDDVLALPAGYERALSLSLAEDLAGQYGRQFNAPQQAKGARDVLKRRNVVVPVLSAFDPA